MKVAVAIEKSGRVSRHMGTCRGFLIFQEDRGHPVMKVIRLNPLGRLVFGPPRSDFPRLNKGGVKQFMSGSLAFYISRTLGDCDALLCRGGGPLISRHLKEKGLQVITTQISDPQKALGVYWNQIKKRAA